MLLVAWHGMIWSNGDRSWWPRLDAARIICFGFQDFQNFPWFWDLQIPVEIFEKFQDFKSCNKETCVIFFPWIIIGRTLICGQMFFSVNFSAPTKWWICSDLGSFKWVTFPSWIRPQRDFSGDFFYQGANMIHQCGTVAKFFPFWAQCIHKTWLAIWSSTSLMHQWSFCRLKSVCSLVGTSCGTNMKHRKTRSGGAISEKSCFCRPFGWFWGWKLILNH